MDKVQFEAIKTAVFDFNRTATSEAERREQAYYLKCCDLLDEEILEGCLAKEAKSGNTAPTVSELDAWCDIIVTGIQCVDCVSPSLLDWEYVAPLFETNTQTSYRNVFLMPVINAIKSAEVAGCDLFGAMMAVCRSNMSKLPPLSTVLEWHGSEKPLTEFTVEIACDAAAEFVKSYYRDIVQGAFEVKWRISVDPCGVDRVVFYQELSGTGFKNISQKKVLKPLWYQAPNLRPYLKGSNELQ